MPLRPFRDLVSRARAGARLLTASASVRVQSDIPYATVDGHRLLLDLYRPEASHRDLPCILMLHGGAWQSGSKEQVSEVAGAIARAGYAVACPNYRLAPRWVFPAQIEDAATAVQWVREHADELGISAKRVGACGFSAGAHLAALLGTSGEPAERIAAVVAVSGPYDLYRMERMPDEEGLAYFLGGTYRQVPQVYRAASPVLLASPDSAPMLLIHGTEDALVLPENDMLLAGALRKAGVEVEIIAVHNAGHVLQPVNGAPIDPPLPAIMLRVAAFLERHL